MNQPRNILKSTFSIIATTVLIAFTVLAGDYRKEIKRTDEKEIRLKLESAFGGVVVKKGDDEHILQFDLQSKDESDPQVDINYRVRNAVGTLKINSDGQISSGESKKSRNIHINNIDIETGKWYIRLTDALPVSIDASLGIGRGEFDLTGLIVRDLKLSTGASSTTVRFNELNKGEMEDFRIESGVSKFIGEQLGNANFKRMVFEGGVGSYTLNFNGNLDHEVDVEVKIGLGTITLIIPQNVGAKVTYDDHWFSSFTIDKDFDEESDGVYVTSNYAASKAKMNITVESGLGSIKIRRSH